MFVEMLLFVVVLFILSFFFTKRNPKFPPGPLEFPFLGNKVLGYENEAREMKKKYGDIFMTKFGNMRLLYLADFKLAKEAFSKLEFADRPAVDSFLATETEKKNSKSDGVILSNGPTWHNNRRFLLRRLRDLGMGKSKLEDAVLTEAENLVKEVDELTTKPSELPFAINIAILNVVWQLIASHRYDYKDQYVKKFMAVFHEAQSNFTYAAIADFFPVFKMLPKFVLNYWFSYDKFSISVKKFQDLIQPIINEHKKNLDPSNPKDVMDDYLVELTEKKLPEYSHFSEHDLMRNVFDLFVAGSDTTSNMCHWIILYLAKYRDIQEEIQKQIDKVVPKDSLPRLEHRADLPLIDAVINEVSRHCSLINFGVFRSTNRDVEFQGYLIPKGTVVTSISVLSNKDPKYWKNPEEFNPKRFIGENGMFSPQTEGYQPFGLGKRQCLGEPLARMELYLFMAALLKNFTFDSPPGEEIDNSPVVVPLLQLPNRKQKYLIKRRN